VQRAVAQAGRPAFALDPPTFDRPALQLNRQLKAPTAVLLESAMLGSPLNRLDVDSRAGPLNNRART
jgi:hypothetical protein